MLPVALCKFEASIIGTREHDRQMCGNLGRGDVEPYLAVLDGSKEVTAGTGRLIDAGVGEFLLGVIRWTTPSARCFLLPLPAWLSMY